MVRPAERPVVVVLGSFQMDLIGVAPRMPGPGETLRGERFYTAPGGKGANQAVAAARLGARVRMVGRLGDDLFGPMLLDNLRDHGIDVSRVAIDPEHRSGVSMILIDSQKENYIVAAYGANLACDDEQVRAVESALDGADSLLLQLEIPFEVSLAAARAAKTRGVRVIWDPAPATDLPADAYSAMDIVTPNQIEAAALTGIDVTDATSGLQAAGTLVERGAAVAVVKMAEQGACYASPQGSGYVPPYRAEAVDTVAAGDAFGGALVVALGEGKGLEDAVRYGGAAGALAVTKPGAQDAMPSREEVEALLSAA